MHTNKPKATSKGGYVLLAVIGMLTLAAILVTLAMDHARINSAQTRADLDIARARLGIQSGIAKAIFLLNQPGGFAANTQATTFEWEGMELQIRMISDLGLVGLNSADANVLQALINEVAPTDVDGQAISQAILDWRDTDEDPRPYGAERRAYTSQDMPPPGNRPFVHITELRRVLGMNDALYAAMAPFISVTTTIPKPDPKYAPHRVLEMLDLPPSQLAQILEARETGQDMPRPIPTNKPNPTQTKPQPDPRIDQTADTDRLDETNKEEKSSTPQSVINTIYHAYVQVRTDNQHFRAEQIRIHIHEKKDQYDLYERHVIDYGSAAQIFDNPQGF